MPVVKQEPVAPKPGTPGSGPGTGPGQNSGTEPGQNPEPGTGPGQNPGTEPATGPGQIPGTEPITGSGRNPGTNPEPGQDPKPAPGQPDPNKPDPNTPKQPDNPDDQSGLPNGSDDPEAPICKRVGDCETDSGSKAINHQNREGPDISYDAKFKAHYRVEGTDHPVSLSDRYLGRFVAETGENTINFVEDKWSQAKVFSNPGAKVTNDGYYSAEYNAMIGFEKFTANDETDKSERVPSAELQWQNMKSLKGDGIRDLQWAGGVYITTPHPQKVISDANKVKNGSKGKARSPSKWTKYTPEDEAWKELADSDNAKGYFYMLGDHHEELNGLKVKEMYAWAGSNKAYLILRLSRD